MNNNVLISTAFLNAIWEKSHKDSIDLLLPFFKYSVWKNTKIGEKIDISIVTEYFKTEFGYDTIPHNVVLMMLKRLSPKTVSISHSHYTLIEDLHVDAESFDKKRKDIKAKRTHVGEALRDFLNSKKILHPFDADTALNCLIEFFVSEGICIIRDIQALALLKQSDDKIKYLVAQFILQEYNNHSIIFDYLEEIVRGFFISTAISLQPANSSISEAKFKDLSCYLDTTIILNALGLHSEESHKAASEFLSMLRTENVKMFCFEHNYCEIYDIINAYKYSLQNPYKNRSIQTLEAWDEKKYSIADVDRYLSMLHNKIEGLGISIVQKPSYNNSVIDETGFRDFINDAINYHHDEALQRDIDSIVSIYRLRNGFFCREIEKCRYLFVTSNGKLSNVANDFFSKEIKDNVPLVIADVSFSSIVWLKSYVSYKNYPKHRLIENAMSAIEPSSSFISLLFEKLDKIREEGLITEEEAAVFRMDLFCKRELFNNAYGESSNLSEESILAVRDQLRAKYTSNEREKTNGYISALSKEREERGKERQNAIQEIEETRNRVFKKTEKGLKTVLYVLISILILLASAFIVKEYIDLQCDLGLFWTICAAVVFVTNILGLIDLISGRIGVIKKIIGIIASHASAKKAEKKQLEYEKIFGEKLS